MSLSQEQYQTTVDQLDNAALCIIGRSSHFRPYTPAYREVLQIQILVDYMRSHFVEHITSTHLFCE